MSSAPLASLQSQHNPVHRHNKAKTFSNGSLWNLFLTNICARQTVVRSSLMKKSVTIRRNLEPPCACGTLESGPPPTDEGRAISRAWLFNNTHLQSGSPHTAAYTWASHLPAQLWHPFWPHCLETKRSMEFWVMAKWVTMVTLYPSAPPTYLHLFTTHTEDATHINVFQPTHSPPSHTHTHTLVFSPHTIN